MNKRDFLRARLYHEEENSLQLSEIRLKHKLGVSIYFLSLSDN